VFTLSTKRIHVLRLVRANSRYHVNVRRAGASPARFLFFCHNIYAINAAMRQFVAIGLFLALLAPAHAADAEKNRDIQLDKLFGTLHQTSASTNHAKIEADIWAIWAHNDSATAELLLRQAVAAMNAHEYDAAEKMLIQLVETYPNFAEAWNKRATLYFMQNRLDASLIDIEHVLELEPRHFGALAGKAMILRAQGKVLEALKVLRETQSINPYMESVTQAIKDIEKANPDI
jgi:tetratricopeptide (TPR) repeat protein